MHTRLRRAAASIAGTAAASALILTGLVAPAAGAEPTAPPAPTTTSGPVAAGDPSLEQQNAARNHAMGSTFDLDASAKSAAPVGPSVQPGEDSPVAGTQSLAPMVAGFPPGVPGLDVSGWQENVNWASVAANGAKFAYVKATEDTDYRSSQFSQQYNGSYAAGLIRGAYHFATPSTSSGAAQARWFVQNGGGWVADGRTLPPLLDIEFNPYNNGLDTCWGLSPAQMVGWISDFVNTTLALTGRPPAIYTNTNWWNRCTGGNGGFGNHPLFIANYPNDPATGAGTMPAGWGSFTFWQFRAAGFFPGDQDVFNGALSDLQAFALGNRVSGADRFGTSAALSATFSAGVPVAYVASGYGFADALSGAAAAGAGKGPVLLVQPYSVPAVVANELKRLKPQRIVVLGGANAVTASVFSSLGAYTSGGVSRVAGSDRFETSAAVSAKAFAPSPGVGYIATGQDFPDALSGAAVAAGAKPGPVLLVRPAHIPPSVATELRRLKPQRIVVLGGRTAVSDAVLASLREFTAGTVSRIAGSNRLETSAAISAANFAPGVATLYVAVGDQFPDSLSGAPVAGAARAPVLLTWPTWLQPSTIKELQRLKPKKIVILGGPSAVTSSVAAQLQKYVVR
ncbi:cell wall-binding repeat-containing protein [Leifsonia sp. fls2-241-R2A-40a]|uniref:cell wall-binding repeat-containing protein n=1 Tax=Leifsonia sp. fls2-241-R2A-40a TaxID=3040290 RepID=UPI002550DC92|nr:cell wall-binding repeat-containing protein [Leifsonia sp. fls2-241-R2A-40a]